MCNDFGKDGAEMLAKALHVCTIYPILTLTKNIFYAQRILASHECPLLTIVVTVYLFSYFFIFYVNVYI